MENLVLRGGLSSALGFYTYTDIDCLPGKNVLLIVFFSFFQELLTSTSEKLFQATKARFDTINILLPSSWSGSDCLDGRPINDQINFTPSPDFKVTSEHPLFGATQPLAIQYGGCGQSGKGIQIPYHLLTQQNLTESTSKYHVLDNCAL